MCTAPVSVLSSDPQHTFVTLILPRVETHARIHSCNIRCPQKRADFISEVIALAWKWYRRLVQRGRDATEFVSAIADFAVRAVRDGRRVTGMEKPNDVMSSRAQKTRGFTVSKLPDQSTLSSNPLAEALHETRRWPPPEVVAFKCDLAAWLKTHTQRHRRIIKDMAMGERTLDLSKKFGMSPGRVSQLRREYQDDWQHFIGDLPPREAMAESAA